SVDAEVSRWLTRRISTTLGLFSGKSSAKSVLSPSPRAAKNAGTVVTSATIATVHGRSICSRTSCENHRRRSNAIDPIVPRDLLEHPRFLRNDRAAAYAASRML